MAQAKGPAPKAPPPPPPKFKTPPPPRGVGGKPPKLPAGAQAPWVAISANGGAPIPKEVPSDPKEAKKQKL